MENTSKDKLAKLMEMFRTDDIQKMSDGETFMPSLPDPGKPTRTPLPSLLEQYKTTPSNFVEQSSGLEDRMRSLSEDLSVEPPEELVKPTLPPESESRSMSTSLKTKTPVPISLPKESAEEPDSGFNMGPEQYAFLSDLMGKMGKGWTKAQYAKAGGGSLVMDPDTEGAQSSIDTASGIYGDVETRRKEALAQTEKEKDRQARIAERALMEKYKSTSTTSKPSEFQKVFDREAAKDMVSWVKSGRETVNNNLLALSGVADKLESSKSNILSPTGSRVGMMPESLRPFLAPESQAMIEEVRNTVVSSLKEILGAQFTEKEGERIMNLAYNPALPPEQNVEKLNRQIESLSLKAQIKDSRLKYAQSTGGLVGWELPPELEKKMRSLDPQHLNNLDKSGSDIGLPKTSETSTPPSKESGTEEVKKELPQPDSKKTLVKAARLKNGSIKFVYDDGTEEIK